MRLAPVPLAFAAHPQEALMRAGENARTTHGAPQAIDSCRLFTALTIGALAGGSVAELLGPGTFEPMRASWSDPALHPEVVAVGRGSFREKEPPEIQGAGYVIRTLEAALWALWKARSFEEGVLLAVNLGDDADTVGAVFGQIAGTRYGASAIPSQWRSRLVMSDRIEAMADQLFDLSRELGQPR